MILCLHDVLDVSTFLLCLRHVFLSISHPIFINVRSLFFPLCAPYIRHRSVLDEATEEWSSVVNIVYTEDSGNATPSVRLCDHKYNKVLHP